MRLLTLSFLFCLSIASYAQGCNAAMTYFFNGNVLHITDASSTGCSSWNGCCTMTDYGDPSDGFLNSFSPWGNHHYYADTGLYEVCQIVSYQDGTGCSCSDTTCYQIQVDSIPSDTCHAEFCYDAFIDTNGVIYASLFDLSTSSDSIVNYYWDYYDGNQSTIPYDHNYSYYVFNTAHPTALYIQTASGCESVFYDTITAFSNCGNIFSIEENEGNKISLYPNPANDVVELSEAVDWLEIYSLSGVLVSRMEWLSRFSVAEFPAGIYILKSSSNKSTRLVVQH